MRVIYRNRSKKDDFHILKLQFEDLSYNLDWKVDIEKKIFIKLYESIVEKLLSFEYMIIIPSCTCVASTIFIHT